MFVSSFILMRFDASLDESHATIGVGRWIVKSKK